MSLHADFFFSTDIGRIFLKRVGEKIINRVMTKEGGGIRWTLVVVVAEYSLKLGKGGVYTFPNW